MTRHEARLLIAERFGGSPVASGPTFRFGSTQQADECKEVLDALDPGYTGEVFGMARLVVTSPDQVLELAREFTATAGG